VSDLSTREQILPSTAPGEDVVLELTGDGDFRTGEMTLSIGPGDPPPPRMLGVVP
jgi:hypothetical protein